jgi:hypothetical protein
MRRRRAPRADASRLRTALRLAAALRFAVALRFALALAAAPRARRPAAVPLLGTALRLAVALVLAATLSPRAAPAEEAPPPAADSVVTEPPPEVPEGTDYEVERADSLSDASLEVGFSASGRSGERPRSGRRVRFRGDGVSAQVREGAGDPLAGAAIDTRGAGGVWRAGRLAPRWGRGLVLGSAGLPWSRSALDRGDDARFRGRAGDGLSYRRAGTVSVDALAGRFSRNDLACLRLGAGGASAGLVGARGGDLQWSLGLERPGGEGEIALERSGRWRMEAATGRALGPVTLAAQARGGSEGFRSLAEPARSGPAHAAAVSAAAPLGCADLQAIGALWRFRPGLAGARGALEVGLRFAQHDLLALGVEEQQGARRISSSAPPGTRRGAWAEWRGGPPGLSLALRHEAWGEDRLARHAVRVVSGARVAARGPLGTAVEVAHTVFHARRGESLYLAEAEADRLIVRALSGDGERTRIEFRAPAVGGTLRAALDLAATGGKPPRPRWALDWSRRARARSIGSARGP